MNSLRQTIRQVAPLRRAVTKTMQQRRAMGGGQPVSQSMQAELFEGHPKTPEGWEKTVYATYAASAFLITLALGFAPDTTIASWASDEARARLELEADGKLEAKEFGSHYNVPEVMYDWECKNPDNPFNEEDDDDDDDDEDDEDDDEEEEEDDDDE